MVFQTIVNYTYNKGPDQFWKTRRILKLSSHFYGRRRNCYRNAIRGVWRSLRHCTLGRQDKKRDMKELQDLRIHAGSMEHGLPRGIFKESIERCLILLNRKILADLAVWEPRTFKALTDVAKAKALEDKLEYDGMKSEDVSHFIHRGLLKKK
ncbi:hypothetical protein PGB90_003394 [Kerria lacca]